MNRSTSVIVAAAMLAHLVQFVASCLVIQSYAERDRDEPAVLIQQRQISLSGDVEENYIRSVQLVEVIDGDTVDLLVDLGWDIQIEQRIRLAQVDTPEVRGSEKSAGLFVEGFVRDTLTKDDPELFLRSVDYSKDKYGRAVGVIYVNGQSLNDLLLERKLAWPTDPDGRLLVPRDLSILVGITE